MSTAPAIIRQRRKRRNQARLGTRQRSQRTVLGLGFILSVAFVLLILAAVLTYASLTRSLPPLEQMMVLLNPRDGLLLQPTRLYDRTGQHLVATLAPTEGVRPYVAYDQFPPDLVQATLALVEPDFWNSPGYSLKFLLDPQVHPTLAQQLVSDLVLWDQPPSLLRSIHERMLAGQLTSRYGRRLILEWYLNSANYGHYAYGAEAAARLYLGKPVAQLNLSEAALLAGVSQAPALNPLDAPGVAEARRVQTLMVMQGMGLLSLDQAFQTIALPPALAAQPADPGSLLAPAFVNLVLAQLEKTFGSGRVERGGLVVRTSLDYDLQLQSLCTLQNQLARLAGESVEIPALDGSPCTAALLLPALQPGDPLPGASASALLLDPLNGEVLAVVGDVTAGVESSLLSSHPAGTSITPFIYLTGFTRGLNPSSLAWDVPASEPLPGVEYHGPLRLRTALVNDYINPARGILEQMGVESVQTIAAPFGLELPSSLLSTDFEISPLSLAGAYQVFAASGFQAGQSPAGSSLGPSTVLQVSGVDHSPWANWTSPLSQSLLSPQLAYLMNQVLSDEAARWPSLGHPNPLEIGRPAGVLLSRSLDSSGAWTVGYTPQRLAVVHLQAADGEELSGLPAADLWHALLQYSIQDLPATSWVVPQGITTVSVCDPSGLLPTAACPSVVSEVFLEGRQPVQVDDLYQTFQVNRATGLLATVFTPPELVEARTYLVVPAQARLWAQMNDIETPPSAYDTLQVPPVLEDVHISAPAMFSNQRGKMLITGTAAGADFSYYRFEYGQGLYPRTWVQIGLDVNQPRTGDLLMEWDTTGLDGLYALRLMVVRSDQRVEQSVLQVTLDNTPPQVAITYPQAGQEISLAQEARVALQAQVNDPFTAKVEFFIDDSSLGETDLAPYGVLWQATPGLHTLRVTATDLAGNTTSATLDFSVK